MRPKANRWPDGMWGVRASHGWNAAWGYDRRLSVASLKALWNFFVLRLLHGKATGSGWWWK